MQKDTLYLQMLEKVIKNQLLPVFHEYYLQRGEAVPELEIEGILQDKVPAICKSWPLENKAGVLTFTSHERKPRKN